MCMRPVRTKDREIIEICKMDDCAIQSAPTLMQGDLIRESIYMNKSVPWKKRQGTGMYAGSAWQNLGLPTSGEDYSANFQRANVF
jgi:hypothetical protein